MNIMTLFEYLDRYFWGYKEPQLSKAQRYHIVGEVISGFKVLKEYPDISYEEWWEKLHEVWEEELNDKFSGKGLLDPLGLKNEARHSMHGYVTSDGA